MGTLKTLYNLLQVNRKIEDVHVRLMYLKDVWGMEQALIGECEGVSQSYVSKELITARTKVTYEQVVEQTLNIWTAAEIQYLQMLPREIIKDMQVLAFIENILGVFPKHPFFQYLDTSTNVRIAALSSLDIQNKRLMVLFDKSQPSISMIVKRSKERSLEMVRQARYDKIPEYKLKVIPIPFKFTKAGGQQ